ncbi:zf-CCHC domain-containing protein [Tanacetum coccineum]
MKETPYELLKDTKKKQTGKNEEAKMTIYNALPCKEYERVFMCKTAKEVWHTLIIIHQGNSPVKNCKIDLITQEYEKAKVTAIKEAKDLATLPLDELIGNLKVYEMVLDNDGVASKITTKEKVKSLALKAKVTREQTSDDSDSHGGSDEDIDEEEAEAFNLLARNFHKFFRKGNRFGHDIQFGNGGNQFGKGCDNNFGNKGSESSKPKGACYNCGMEGHFASECRKSKENKAFMGGA